MKVEMGETFNTHGRELHTRFWWENLKKVDDFGALSWVGVVVKQILEDSSVWPGFIDSTSGSLL
jgi:hypothetical protein